MRIIIVADNASRQFGGEAFIPLNCFRLLLARGHDVRLVVHGRNKSELTQQFSGQLDLDLDLCGVARFEQLRERDFLGRDAPAE